MKRVLILVIGCQVAPWERMINTSRQTWDSIDVEGTDTIFYCGEPVKENTSKIIYFPVQESFRTMGEKFIMALEWVLKNNSFDYIARVNSSCYVNKKALIKYIQNLPETNHFEGLEVGYEIQKRKWLWGGGQFIFSRDVAQKFVDNKIKLKDVVTEDVAISFLAQDCGIPFSQGRAAAIDKIPEGWRCIVYGGGESFNFTDFKDFNTDNHFIRVKQDNDRMKDEWIMKQLYDKYTEY